MTLARAFLFFFLADGVWALANGLLGRVAGVAVLPGFGALLGLGSGLLALTTYVALGFSPRLPKRVLVPPCLFLLWSAAGGMPLPLTLGLADAALLVSALQVVVGSAALGLFRQLAARGEGPGGDGRRWRHALGFFGANLILLPPAAAVYLGWCLALATAHFTGGFVSLGWGGISAQERVYERGDRRVHLVAMIHVADGSFYRSVLAGVPPQDAVVLLEGVTDREGLLPSFSYGRLAAALGLEAQEESLAAPPALTTEPADVDVGTFSPATVAVLVAAGRVLASDSPEAFVAAYGALAAAGSRPGALDALRADLIDRRDEHLLARLEEALGAYRRAVVPWGAAHLPGIEAGLLARGFRLADTRERTAIGFARTPSP